MIKCRKCGCQRNVKNGFTKFYTQKYKCKNCGCTFVEKDKRIKYGLNDKLKVIKLYLENCALRSIERLTGIRNYQVSLWIEQYAEEIKKEITKLQQNDKGIKNVSIMEIDELCTYVKKSPEMEESIPLYGLLLTETQEVLLTLK